MNIRPTNKKLIAKLYEEPKKEEIIITVKENPRDRYIVTAISDNDQNIKVGDLILCHRMDVLEKEIQDEKIYIIPLERVIGVIE